MRILSVVFDYGSVLAWPPSSAGADRIAAKAGIPASVLLERYYRERSAYDHGTVTGVEYWRHITEGFPASEDDGVLRELVAMDVEIWSERNEATIGWLPELKKHGLVLGILSNMPASFSDALEERDRWLRVVDTRIYSGKVRLSKPDPAIYELALERLNEASGAAILAENVLFLDDLEANVRAAESAGFNAELYNVFDGGLGEIASRYGLPRPTEPRPTDTRLRDIAFAPHRQPR